LNLPSASAVYLAVAPLGSVFKCMTKRDRRINKRGGEARTSRFRAATDCRVSDGPNHRDLISPQRNKQTLVSGIADFFFYAKRPLNARPAVWVDCWKASLRSADNPSGADLGAIYSPRPNEGGHRKHPRGHSAYLPTNSASGVFCEPRYCSCASCQWGVPKSQKSKRQRSCRRQARTLKIQTV
jgi:hypothetical protein